MHSFDPFFHDFIFFDRLNLDKRDAQQRFFGETPRVELVLVYKQGVLVENDPPGQQAPLSLDMLAELALVNDVVVKDLLEGQTLQQTASHLKVLYLMLIHWGHSLTSRRLSLLLELFKHCVIIRSRLLLVVRG